MGVAEAPLCNLPFSKCLKKVGFQDTADDPFPESKT